jgi:hypothetical protein
MATNSTNVISNINQGMFSYFQNLNVLNIVSWVVFAIILIGAVWFYLTWWKNKKVFNKKITDFEIVGVNFVPTIRDFAKTEKIGSGGFEILYLKKQKTWRLAYGGRIGKDTYYFFKMPDGYPYNAMLSANMFKIDELKGLIPVVTTNASMRSQYTSLEKQIDSLHKAKPKFWEQYGGWVMGIVFVLVAGIMFWLMWREFATVTSNLNSAITSIGSIADKLATLTSNIKTGGSNGLVPA